MPKGTTELQILLKDAAARVANEKGQGQPAPSAPPAAVPPVARPVAKRPAAKKATAKVAAAKRPAPAAVPSPAPRVDLEAIEEQYPPTGAAAASSPPPPPPAPSAAPSQWQPTPSQWQPTPSPTPPVPAVPSYAPYRDEPRGRKVIVIGAVVAGLAIAGGGAGVLVANLGAGPSKAEYVKKADDVCRASNAPVVAIVKPTSYPELATASGAVVTASRGQVTQLRGLDRPSGGNGTAAEAFVSSLDATAIAAQHLQDAATAKDDAAAIAATHGLGAAFNDAKAKAGAFGLTACGTGMVTGIDTLYAGSAGVVKTAFIAKADAMCRSAARDMDNVAEPRNGTGREVARYLSAVFAIGDKLLADLKALPVAPGDETAVAEMLAAQDKVDLKSHDLSAAAAAEDQSRFLAADKELSPLVTAADGKFDAYGLSICGSNFGAY